MTQAPERIWVEKSIAEEGNHGSTAWPEREDGSEIEYIRADLSPDVKPLEWEDYPVVDGPVMSMSVTPIGTYFICDDMDDFSGLYCELVTHQSATWFGSVKPKKHVITQYNHTDDFSPIKAAAQEDYKRRILSALTTRPTAAEDVNGLIGDLLRLVEQPERHAQYKGEIVAKAKARLDQLAGEQGQ
jgi:hypothetical protein